MSLPVRKFVGILDVGQVLMVCDDGDRVRCSLNVLMPFCESKNDCKQFSVIDIIILFGREEGTREVGTGMEVAVGVSLEQNSSCCK